MMGGQLRPAQPAIGVVVCDVGRDGVLQLDDRRPSPWRMFTPQDEEMDSVEFCPAESDVPLRAATFGAVCEIAADELYLVGPTEIATGLDGAVSWRSRRRRSQVFGQEQIWFDAVSNNVDALVAGIENALKLLSERRIGWLRLSLERVAKERVRLIARIDPAGAFERTAPGGFALGGDLEGDWGMLDGSTWTPTVTVRKHALLPPHIQEQYPLPGFEEGQILITDVPENFPVADLLERRASPVPESIVEAIWQTLANQDARLAPIRPVTRVVFTEPEIEAEDLEPTWVSAALASGAWSELSRNQPKTVFHLTFADRIPAGTEDGRVRVALVFDAPHTTVLPQLQAFALQPDLGVDRRPVEVREVWRLPLPPWEEGQSMPTVVAYDLGVRELQDGLLIATSGPIEAAFVNAMLVINAPAVPDGRSIPIQRNTPAAYGLLYEDLVDRLVVEQLLEEPIPASTASIIRNLPISYLPVAEQEPIKDFKGVRLDAAEGTFVINAPDDEGQFRPFRPGARIRLEWYRRTNGARGNRKPGNIRLVEQPVNMSPRIDAVINPLGTFFGSDRESPEAAVHRMFGPTEGTPVMAADYERLVRQVLGQRARDWTIRCWTYAERALISTAFWPFPRVGDEPDADVQRTMDTLANAGPDTLLIVLGPTDQVIDDEDLDWARRAVQRLVERWARRMPTVRHAVVGRFWPLRLTISADAPEPLLPSYELEAMDGELSDIHGRAAGPRPRAVLLLNAAVTAVVRQVADEEGA
jgi:hypothetical protein